MFSLTAAWSRPSWMKQPAPTCNAAPMAGLIREQQVARGNANSNMYEAVINSWRRLRRTREPAPLFASVMLLPASFHEGRRFHPSPFERAPCFRRSSPRVSRAEGGVYSTIEWFPLSKAQNDSYRKIICFWHSKKKKLFRYQKQVGSLVKKWSYWTWLAVNIQNNNIKDTQSQRLVLLD